MKRAIWVLVLLAVAAGGYYAFFRIREQRTAQATSSYQTQAATRGDLTASVGATGVVRANQTAILTWQTTGSIEKVSVAVGDSVKSGQELASLEQTSLPQNIILAQADLVNAKKALEDLYDMDLALAQAEQTLANAKKAVTDTTNRLANVQTDSPQTDIDQAKANVVLAKNALDKAKKNYKPFENKDEDNIIRAVLLSKLADAQEKYDAAVRKLNNLQGTASSTTVEIANSDLTVAQANLAEAQRRYDELKAGPAAEDVTTAQTRIAAAEATLKMARLEALFAGTITEVAIKPGDQVSPGVQAFRVDDLSKLIVDVQVSEVDINSIQPGQEVSLSFDAIPGKTYKGAVSEVALVGTSNEGVVDFKVSVQLTDPDESVRPGMTAAVNIVVRQLQDVLLVPNRAVRVKDGQRVVYVLRNQTPEAVQITLGASSEVSSEVIEGDLVEGDAIILNPPTVFEQNGPPAFMRR